MADTTVFITLGSGNEFGISDSSMFVRKPGPNYYDDMVVIDLGPPTRKHFDQLLNNLECMRCHLEE